MNRQIVAGKKGLANNQNAFKLIICSIKICNITEV